MNGWYSAFRRDVARYRAHSGGGALKHLLTEQGLWALLEYRASAALYRSHLPKPIKAPLWLASLVWHKIIEVTTGISLPCTSTLGPGLHIPHVGTRVLHAMTVMGSDCCITSGVTIGISGRGERRGVPAIGDRVYIGPNAVIVGKITVGNDSVIGANSLVNRDVPANCTVLGVPAVIVSQHGSAEYL